ncbi:NAD(P)/FAD-dependent oxidoreductase [Sporichthya sp.]|uniref:flavin-containing monooxygenase n=1 Tax=Sporichthya sp. TaxID=65475 RepID=UPI001851CE98|nr:NAD(P)/FAD-dependent oxidoreductase [Sporichthya sp.]MBA3741891.1 NAD(P)/FAD-dependent oxidoreductase [Sporichthya sp.]
MSDHVDVLIIGAGLSGIGAAARLQRERPGLSYEVLEARDAIGGTWDLFQYPGIRSDTDAFTMGFSFKPWKGRESITSGDSLRTYIRDLARESGVDSRIRYRTKALGASWSSADARWTVRAESAGAPVEITANFVYLCTGYYDYDKGHTPHFPGQEDFAGTIVHPQFWPKDLDYTGKRVVVIGSGATAITLVPSMAPTAGHVTMLQRTPSWVLSLPAVDQLAVVLQKVLPAGAAHRVVRAKNVLTIQAMYALSRRRPDTFKRICRRTALHFLKDSALVDEHFTPNYEPWDQRLCLVPDGDLFKAIRGGSVDVVTDHIERFESGGIRLTSGRFLEAEVIVSATGLALKPLGGLTLEVDGKSVDIADTLTYRAWMLSGVPNFGFCFGYSNNSWTLRADLSARYLTRLLGHLASHGYDTALPTPPAGMERRPFLDLSSGYVQRGIAQFPKAGTSGPWLVTQNYLGDVLAARRADITEDIVFSTRTRTPARVG